MTMRLFLWRDGLFLYFIIGIVLLMVSPHSFSVTLHIEETLNFLFM